MNTLYFYNKEVAEIDALTTLGLSVKNEGSIGRFGTGFKYAIALLLRTGHKVTLILDGVEHEFRTQSVTIRGEAFQKILLGRRDLNITTMFGKDWKLWMAYRELVSNALDEGGFVTNELPEGMGTIIKVEGAAFYHEGYLAHDTIFCGERKVFYKDLSTTYREYPSQFIYFRGIRAAKYKETLPFTLDIQNGTLNEMRELTDLWGVESHVRDGLFNGPVHYLDWVLSRATVDSMCFYRGLLNRTRDNPMTEEAARWVMRNADNPRINIGTVKNAALTLGIEYDDDRAARRLTDNEVTRLEPLLELLPEAVSELTNTDLNNYRVMSDDSTVGAMAESGRIYLTEDVLDFSDEELFPILLEEEVHRQLGYRDCTRRLQNFLFQKIAAFAWKQRQR